MGCPGEEHCDDLKQSSDACKTCPTALHGGETGNDLVDYTQYLFQRWKRWKKGLLQVGDLEGYEVRWIDIIDDEIQDYQRELHKRTEKP